jgi:hypothetical protein
MIIVYNPVLLLHSTLDEYNILMFREMNETYKDSGMLEIETDEQLIRHLCAGSSAIYLSRNIPGYLHTNPHPSPLHSGIVQWAYVEAERFGAGVIRAIPDTYGVDKGTIMRGAWDAALNHRKQSSPVSLLYAALVHTTQYIESLPQQDMQVIEQHIREDHYCQNGRSFFLESFNSVLHAWSAEIIEYYALPPDDIEIAAAALESQAVHCTMRRDNSA